MQGGTTRLISLALMSCVGLTPVHNSQAQRPARVFVAAVPTTWDNGSLASLEVPLPHPEFSREPELLWDDQSNKPPLHTESDWIKAGEMVFDAAMFDDSVASADDARNPDWYRKVAPPTTKDGIAGRAGVCTIRMRHVSHTAALHQQQADTGIVKRSTKAKEQLHEV